MAVDPPIVGFNEILAAAVNSAAVRHCGDSGSFIDVSDGSTSYTCNIYLDRVSGTITGDLGPEEPRPFAEIPFGQIPEPSQGDKIVLLGQNWGVDSVSHDNGIWRMGLRALAAEATGAVLLETGDGLLLETGDALLLEAA